MEMWDMKDKAFYRVADGSEALAKACVVITAAVPVITPYTGPVALSLYAVAAGLRAAASEDPEITARVAAVKTKMEQCLINVDRQKQLFQFCRYLNTMYCRWVMAEICRSYFFYRFECGILMQGIVAFLSAYAYANSPLGKARVTMLNIIHVFVGALLVSETLWTQQNLGWFMALVGDQELNGIYLAVGNSTSSIEAAAPAVAVAGSFAKGLIEQATPETMVCGFAWWALRWGPCNDAASRQVANMCADVSPIVKDTMETKQDFGKGTTAIEENVKYMKTLEGVEVTSGSVNVANVFKGLCVTSFGNSYSDECGRAVNWIENTYSGAKLLLPRTVEQDSSAHDKLTYIARKLFEVDEEQTEEETKASVEDVVRAAFMGYVSGDINNVTWEHQNGVKRPSDDAIQNLNRQFAGKRQTPLQEIVFLKAKLLTLENSYNLQVDQWKNFAGEAMVTIVIKPTAMLTALGVQWSASIYAVLESVINTIPGAPLIAGAISTGFSIAKLAAGAVGSVFKFAGGTIIGLLESFKKFLEKIANWGGMKLTSVCKLFKFIIGSLKEGISEGIHYAAPSTTDLVGTLHSANKEMKRWTTAAPALIEEKKGQTKLNYMAVEFVETELATAAANTTVKAMDLQTEEALSNALGPLTPNATDAHREPSPKPEEITDFETYADGAEVKVGTVTIQRPENLGKMIDTLCTDILAAMKSGFVKGFTYVRAAWNNISFKHVKAMFIQTTDSGIENAKRYAKRIAMALTIAGHNHVGRTKAAWTAIANSVNRVGVGIYNAADQALQLFFATCYAGYEVMDKFAGTISTAIVQMSSDLTSSTRAMYSGMVTAAGNNVEELKDLAHTQYQLTNFILTGNVEQVNELEHYPSHNVSTNITGIDPEKLQKHTDEAAASLDNAVILFNSADDCTGNASVNDRGNIFWL